MKQQLYRNKLFLFLFPFIMILLFFIITFALACPTNLKAASDKRLIQAPLHISYIDTKNPENRVYEIYVTDNSHYLVDKRFNLCFYQILTPYAISVVNIPCNSLYGLIKDFK